MEKGGKVLVSLPLARRVLHASSLLPGLSWTVIFEYVEGPRSHTEGSFIMGDKSPKAKDKAKKQDAVVKNKKKSDASNKASANGPPKKGT